MKTGKIEINSMWTGEWLLKEVETDIWYKLNNEDTSFEIKKDETTTLTIKNDAKRGYIVLEKQDSEFTDKKLSGVVFNIYDQDANFVETITTDTNGIAKSSLLKIDKTYYLVEISTDNYHVLASEFFKVDFKENLTEQDIAEIKSDIRFDLTIENEAKTSSLKINKVDKDNNELPVSEVTFEIFDETTNEIFGTVTTDENGIALVDGLKVTHSYSLKEIDTNYKYQLNEDVITNIIVVPDEVTELTIENERKKAQFKVIKVDADDHKVLLEGVKFEILNSNMEVVEELTTDNKGEAISSMLPCIDETYFLKETQSHKLYELSSEIPEIVLEEDEIKNIIFENYCKTGNIRIIKVDKDNNELPVEGATFEIIDETTDEIVDTIITDLNGFAQVNDLKVTRTYTIRETSVNDKYNINTNEIENIVIKADETIDIQIENEKKKGQVRIIKVDKDNNEVLLEGVKFEILNSNMEVVEELITDNKGEAISSLLPCVNEIYYIRECETLQQYVLNEEIKQIVLVESQIKDIVFENEKIKGYLEITKVDAKNNDIKLSNAEFGIYNENNELVQTIKTSEQGIAISELLVIGKYYVKELSSGSPYYLLNEETFEFEITKNHEVIPMTIKNEPVDIEVTVDKEGDIETKPGQIVNYTFSNIANASNTYLDSFKWFDFIPTDSTRIEKITTGTWNQDLIYNIYYRTNKSEDYILYVKDLSTQENYDIDFTTINLAEDEYITEFYFDFGKVDIGFKENVSPTLECRALETLEDNSTFTNYTKTVGNYYGIEAESNSKWTTIVHVPEEPEPVLPRTGK